MIQLAYINFRKSSYILVEGKSRTDRFYIIQQGKVKCYKDTSVPNNPPVILGPGDFIGVVSCMAGQSQIETAVALTDVIVISVKREQYPELIKNNTPVALKIIHNFANRMRILNETLTQLTLNTIVQPSLEQLYTIADFYYKTKQFNQAVFGYYQYIKVCPNGKNADVAKQRFVALKPKTKAVHLERGKDTFLFYPKGTMIFSECQTGYDMYIIQSGKVKISKVVNDNEVILAVLQQGDFFGEMALLENKPRSASAIAFEDCRLMVVNSNNFDQMVQTQSQLIARLTTTLSERLWSMNRNLINTQITDPVMKLLDMLAIQIEKAKIPLVPKTTHQFDITPYDLANMCGMPKEKQALHLLPFLQDSHIKLIDGKIFVTDCEDLVKASVFYRSKNEKKANYV